MPNVATLQTSADLTASQIAGAISPIMPAGVVLPYAGTSAPAGWLACDGASISRTTYPTLFAAIGTAHGTVDGVTNFNLPDYRGRFIRGGDAMFGGTAAGRDPNTGTRTAANTGGNTGNAVGSVQGHAVRDHDHGLPGGANSPIALTGTVYPAWGSNAGAYVSGRTTGDSRNANYGSLGVVDATTTTASATSTENRPLNAYVNYIIKI